MTVVVLLFVAFMWTSNSTLALDPDRWTVYFDRPDGSFLNVAEPTVWPRWLHMIIGAVSVGGLYLALAP